VATLERSLAWADIWQYEPLRLTFLLRSVYVVLPSPVNLCQWNLTDNRNYRLCVKRHPSHYVMVQSGPKSMKIQMAPWHGLKRARPHIIIGMKEGIPKGKRRHHLHPSCIMYLAYWNENRNQLFLY